MADAVAAFDCGSNSTRLLIVDAAGATLARETVITRLSQGVDSSGALLPEAMERTFAVLARYHAACERAGVSKGLLVATSAVRDARNGDVFLERAQDIVDFEATVLQGEQEAALSYAGATSDLHVASVPTLVVDVGGGSTELAVELDGSLVSHSMQLGCVRVTERALGRGVVTRSQDAAARAMIEAELDRAILVAPGLARVIASVRLVGVAGTVATLAQLDAGQVIYDRKVVHHRVLTRTVVTHWRQRLAEETPEARLTHPGMVQGREDVMPAGLYVLEAVMDRFKVEQLLSSENDILDGIAIALRRS